MKAVAVAPARREIKIVESPVPKIESPAQVKLQILDVGICGTDREICAFQYGTPPPGSDVLVIGHESLGRVVETGPGVSRLKVGDLAVPMVRRPCPHPNCLACRAGRQDFCFTGDFTERGIKGAPGYLTEFVVDDEKFMTPVPAPLRSVAVLVEPLTIAEKAVAQVWDVQERLPWACPVSPGEKRASCHRAVVLGAGPVGILGAMVLIKSGFETYVYSRSPKPNEKAALVESLGAVYVSSEQESVEKLAERVGHIDLVFEAAGASKISFDVIKVLGTNGIFVFTGVPGRKAPIKVDTDLMMRNLVLKNQVVFGTVNAGRSAFEDAVRDLADFQKRWPRALAALITGRHPIEAYRDLLVGKPAGIKNVIALSRE